MAQQTPSLREKIRLYKASLFGEQAKEFSRVFAEESKEKKIKEAFVIAKTAASKIPKETSSE